MRTEKYLELLGKQVKDKVTGFSGIVTSITFDLYGCVQALVHPGLNEKGLIMDQAWFDTNRLFINQFEPVMKNPFIGEIAEKGPENKPIFTKV